MPENLGPRHASSTIINLLVYEVYGLQHPSMAPQGVVNNSAYSHEDWVNSVSLLCFEPRAVVDSNEPLSQVYAAIWNYGNSSEVIVNVVYTVTI